MQTHFDIVIIGGGMVGASLALALLQQSGDKHYRIAIIEKQAMDSIIGHQEENSFDARSTALSYSTRQFFESLGLWTLLAPEVAPIQHIHVSNKGAYGVTRFKAEDEGVDALGYVVENQILGKHLLTALQPYRHKQLEWLASKQVEAIEFTPEGAEIMLQDSGTVQKIQAQLLVLAEGGRSGLTQKLGIDTYVKPYHHTAIVANVTLDKPHHGMAYERFTAEGPIALLPASRSGQPSRCGLVWTLPTETAKTYMQIPEQEFLAALQQVFGYRAGHFLALGTRSSYPISLRIAQESMRRRLVLLGNAAHTLHPIAGQGFNLAIRGVKSLQIALSTVQNDEDCGDLQLLQSYHQSRQVDIDTFVQFTDKTLALFQSRALTSSIMGSLGLHLLDNTPLLKKLFVKKAMGFRITG